MSRIRIRIWNLSGNIDIYRFGSKKFNQARKEDFLTEEKLAGAWLITYAESIAQKRRNIAPIDEPCQQWLVNLKGILEDFISI